MTKYQYLSHEQIRFASMTPKQLLTRLNRITKSEKLVAYIEMAQQLGFTRLVEAAATKKKMMETSSKKVEDKVFSYLFKEESTNKNCTKIINKKSKMITEEIIYRRSIDF